MSKLLAALIALALPIGLCAAPAVARLSYLPDRPVLQTSSLSVEIEQQREDGTVRSSARQEIKAALEIPSTSRHAVKALPLDLTVDLQTLKVSSNVNGRSVAYDSDHPGASPFISEVSKLIGRPIALSVGDDLQVSVDSPEFSKVLQQLEQIGGVRIGNLFSQVIQHLFALAGQDLRVGQEVTRHFALGGDQDVAMDVVYRIAEITDKEVRAVVSGGFDAVEIDQTALAGSQQDVDVSLSLEGRVEGKATWSRNNALVYRTRIDYIYSGLLTVDDVETPIEVRLRHEDNSKPM